MHRLSKPTLGVLFVILSGSSAMAGPQPLALSAPQTFELSNAPEIGAVLAVSQRLDGVSGFNGRFSSSVSAPATSIESASPAPSSTDGLSMLAALAIMGGFVLRRFLR
jgi:hypothetical protein